MNPWLDRGRVRLDVGIGYVFAVVDEALGCEDVDPSACGTIPDHVRARRIDWLQLSPTLSVGLGKGWQLSATVPGHLQILTTRYTLPDGGPYTADYERADDPLRLVGGFADPRLMGWFFGRVGDVWTLGGGLGFTIPLGTPPSDPFGGLDGDLPQPFQSGTGTVDPVAGFTAIASKERWGGWIGANARVPVYRNRLGYLPPWTLTLTAGPSLRVTPEVTLLWTLDGLVQGRAYWSSLPMGGQGSLGTSLTALGMVAPGVVLQGQVGVTLGQWALTPDDQPLGPAVQASFAVSWTPRGKDEHGHADESTTED